MQIAHKKLASLEQKQRLSQSLLWKLQRNFFNRQGIQAWSTGAVPHHITSSPFIADAYARIAFGFLRDCQRAAGRAGSSSSVPLDHTQPVYIVELGSGPGRFAYLFLKKFLTVYRYSVLKEIPVKYVMTDFAELNLDYWRTHPWLQPFIQEGLLDFARFDIGRDQELKLIVSGETLSPENLKNPLLLISNYLFDSIPQDAFFIAEGQLFETLITVASPQKEADPDDPDILSRVEISYHHNPVNVDYYDDPLWNRLLQDYRQRLPGTSFLFPTAALECIQYFHRLSGGRLLLLSGDRGYNRDEALLQGLGKPTMVVHGSFSMMVDYQLLGEYCLNRGGQVLHPAHRHESLNVSAFMFGSAPDSFVETRQAYAEAVEKFGPDDYFILKGGIEQVAGALSLEQLLAFLRLSGWDYKRFWDYLPVLKNHLADINDLQKQDLSEAIWQVWDAYLPIGEENDLAFQLGTLLLEMGFYTEALEYLRHSVNLYSMEPGTAYNMAVCYYNLQQAEQALEHINQALELDPDCDAAKVMRIKLQTTASRQPITQ